METRPRAAWSAVVRTPRVRELLTIWVVVLLVSGQGFRFLLGIPGYGALCLVTVGAALWCYRVPISQLRVPLVVVAFVGLALVSTAWASNRPVTLAAALVLAVVTFLAVAGVRSATAPRFMGLLYRGFQVSLVLGLAFEVIVATVIRRPLYPIATDLVRIAAEADSRPLEWSDNLLLQGGPIQGFVGNRNPFGAIALMAAVLAMVLLLERSISRVDGLVTILASVAVHALTGSATVSAVAIYLACLTVAGLVIRSSPERFKHALSLTTLGAIAVTAVITLKHRVTIFEAFGRSPEATHRTDIWDEIIEFAELRPEGWGYVGYWPVWDYPYSAILDGVGVFATHAHNAYWDVFLQLGVMGLLLLVVLIAMPFGSAWRLVERSRDGETYRPLGWALITAALALQAFTESRLLVEGGWYILVALYCSSPKVFALTIVDPDYVHYAQPHRAPSGTRRLVRGAAARSPHHDVSTIRRNARILVKRMRWLGGRVAGFRTEERPGSTGRGGG